MTPGEVAAANCKRFRRWNNLTQAELARRMTELGISMHQTAVMKIESGNRGMDVNELVALCQIFAVEPEDMLTEDPSWRLAVTS